MPFVLGVSKTTPSFGDLLGLVRFRNFPTLCYSLLQRKATDWNLQREKVHRSSPGEIGSKARSCYLLGESHKQHSILPATI